MATVMTETTTAKVREEQVTGLTAENAHRVTMIREKGTDHPPVPFHFRKEHHGTGNYVHLYGNPEDRNELHSRDFKDWQAVAFKHPGYLDDMWKQACDAYAWSSFNPEIRGETDIMIYGEELHNDLQLMPEGIKKLSEVYDMGYEDYFYSGALCFIEWPELVEELLPGNAVKVTIEELEDGNRVIRL